MPSDSLSRRVAESIPEDTLRILWASTGSDEHPLEYPRTVRFGGAGMIYTADVERESLFEISMEGALREVPLGAEVPYIAGLSGDTLSIFSPASLGVYRVAGGAVVDSTHIHDPNRRETSLVYAAAGERLYYKRVDPEGPGWIYSVSADGHPADSARLDGPNWRHAGLLKFWGDTLMSLSGFRPVVDLLPSESHFVRSPTEANESHSVGSRPETNEASGFHPSTLDPVGSVQRGTRDTRARGSAPPSSLDTLALVGFDSPMLARSRAFLTGEVHEPPLLSPSAAAAGDFLFVMNIRPGWLQIDVFDRGGHLRRRLVPPDRTYRDAYLPHDIDVRAMLDEYEIVVAMSQPEPRIQVFAWRPGD